MEIIDGKWYMEGIDWDDEGCIHSSSELLDVIEDIGFLPLFSNDIQGFSGPVGMAHRIKQDRQDCVRQILWRTRRIYLKKMVSLFRQLPPQRI